MIRIYNLYDRYLVTELTHLCKSITWSGDKEQFARKLEGQLMYSIFDKGQKNAQVGTGSLIWVIEDGIEIFRGYVFDREIDSSGQELNFTAYDYLIYFNKSKGNYNFKNITPEEIVKTICKDAGVEVGSIENTGLPVSFLAKDKSFMEVILQAYTKVWHFNGGKYKFMPYMEKDKFSIIKMGTLIKDFCLYPDKNILNSSFSDSSTNLINKIVIYDDAGNKKSEISNKDSINVYGVLQDTYNLEEGKNSEQVAASKLHGVDRTINVSCIGDTRCTAGYAVKSKIWYVDCLDDVVLNIDSDTHNWDMSTGKHTMDLSLNSTCKMKLIEDEGGES